MADTDTVKVAGATWHGTDDPTQVEVLARLLFGGECR